VGVNLPSNQVGAVGGLYSGYVSGSQPLPPATAGRFTTPLSMSRGMPSYGPGTLAPLTPHSFVGPSSIITQNRRNFGTFQTRGSPSYITRPEKLNAELPQRLRTTGPLRTLSLRETQRTLTPSQYLLNSRNVLSAKSPLSRLLLSHKQGLSPEKVGLPEETPVTEPPTTAPAPEVQTPDSPPALKYNDMLSQKLDDQYKRRFDGAVDLFNRGQYFEARDQFGSCRAIDRSRLEPLLASAFAEHALQNYSSSALDILQAVIQCQKLEELRFDWKSLYREPNKFDDLMVDLNIKVNKGEMNAYADEAMILAYFAWLKGDNGTAISAAQTAEEGATQTKNEGRRKTIERFREMVSAARGVQ